VPLTLAIEVSNPSSGPRGRIEQDGDHFFAGPGVALGERKVTWPVDEDVELLHEGPRHDDDLMPAIDRLFRRRGATPADLKDGRIAVSVGPGGFTGLRIAVATAKMLAEATGARTVAVPSASAAAWCLPVSSAPAVVCLASKGETVHATLLPRAGANGDWWEATGSPALRKIVDPLTLSRTDGLIRAGKGWMAAACSLGIVGAAEIEPLAPRTLIADRFLPASIAAMAGRIGAAIIEPIFAAQSVLHIANGMDPIDPVALAPLYPREPEAVTLWRGRGGGRGGS
jgi:tRNA threonylcarbamoyladenosine biosynthesis protein TsaB